MLIRASAGRVPKPRPRRRRKPDRRWLCTGFVLIQVPIAGAAIRFYQTYRQYFIGLKGDLDLAGYIPLHSFNLTMQLDRAYVQGENEDLHLLRAGVFLWFWRMFFDPGERREEGG